MKSKDIRIRAADGKEFDLHIVAPEGNAKVPAIVLTSAIHGVDNDLKAIAAEFAASRASRRSRKASRTWLRCAQRSRKSRSGTGALR